jgi:hypothetical protein
MLYLVFYFFFKKQSNQFKIFLYFFIFLTIFPKTHFWINFLGLVNLCYLILFLLIKNKDLVIKINYYLLLFFLLVPLLMPTKNVNFYNVFFNNVEYNIKQIDGFKNIDKNNIVFIKKTRNTIFLLIKNDLGEKYLFVFNKNYELINKFKEIVNDVNFNSKMINE